MRARGALLAQHCGGYRCIQKYGYVLLLNEGPGVFENVSKNCTFAMQFDCPSDIVRFCRESLGGDAIKKRFILYFRWTDHARRTVVMWKM